MSYASQQAFEGLGELVEDLMERLEAAEAKAEEQEVAWETKLEEQRVAWGAQMEQLEARNNQLEQRLQDEVASAMANLGARVEVMEGMIGPTMDETTQLVRYDLSGGSGGRGGESVYTAPDGTVVTSSMASHIEATRGPYYYIEYLFSGTQTGASNDEWLVGPANSATLTFSLPLVPLVMVRLHTQGKYPHHGITEFDLSVEYGPEEDRDPFLVSRSGFGRNEWVEVPIPSSRVAGLRFDFRTTTKYLAVDSIELLMHPGSFSNLFHAVTPLLRGTVVEVNTPCSGYGDDSCASSSQ